MSGPWQYQVDSATRDDAVARLRAQSPLGALSTGVGVFHVAPASEFGLLGRAVELDCFAAAYDETAESLAEEYRRYEEFSHFLLMVDLAEGHLIGASRCIDGGVAASKTLAEITSVGPDPAEATRLRARLAAEPRVWGWATFEVVPDLRGHDHGMLAQTMGIRAVLQAAAQAGMSALTSELNPKTQGILTYFGFPLDKLTRRPLRYDDGSEFWPVYLPLADLPASMSARRAELFAELDNRPQTPEVQAERDLFTWAMEAVTQGRHVDHRIDLTPR